MRGDVAGLVPRGGDDACGEVDGVGEEFLDHGGELEVEVFGRCARACVVGEGAESGTGGDAFVEEVHYCALCIARHGDPLPRVVIIEA